MNNTKLWTTLGSLGALATQLGCSGETTVEITTAQQRGEILYSVNRCSNCHGADGAGVGTAAGGPRILGRVVDDLRRQLVEPCVDSNGNVALNAVTDCHPLKLPDLTNSQLSDIEAYLRFLESQPTDADPGPSCDTIPGNICTVAGNGISGNIRGITLARTQNLFWPQNVDVDPQGRLIITDWNNYLIRRMDTNACQQVMAPDGSMGQDCNLVNIVGTSGLGDTCSAAATPTNATRSVMNHPIGTYFDDAGNIVLAGWHQWKIKYIPVNADGTTGELLCLFGGGGRGTGPEGIAAGLGTPSLFNLPANAVSDAAGNWYLADQGNLRIRMITANSGAVPDITPTPGMDPRAYIDSLADNLITTIAGGLRDSTGKNFISTSEDYSNSGDGGPAAMATFRVQFGFDAVPQFRIQLDRATNTLYIADSENSRIRAIDLNTPDRIIRTVVGGGSDLAGTTATTVQLVRPADIDFVPGRPGDLLITDTFGHCIRYYTAATQAVTVIAGVCGQDGYAGDGGPATAALIAEPGGSVITADGTLYIADTLNHRIRRVNNAIPQ